MRAEYADLKAKFHHHKNNAIRRGIDFQLTFDEWHNIWLSSGHLADRGRGRNKYCMSRYNDSGPYAIGNVEIKTNQDNFAEVPTEKLGTKGKPAWNKGIPRTAECKLKQSIKMKQNHLRSEDASKA
jgi:hypothetical protein